MFLFFFLHFNTVCNLFPLHLCFVSDNKISDFYFYFFRSFQKITAITDTSKTAMMMMTTIILMIHDSYRY
jgi:hypothetical protein